MATVSIPGQETAIPHAVQCSQTKYFFKKEQYVLCFVYFTTTKKNREPCKLWTLGIVTH